MSYFKPLVYRIEWLSMTWQAISARPFLLLADEGLARQQELVHSGVEISAA
jgi:hypothetical protein